MRYKQYGDSGSVNIETSNRNWFDAEQIVEDSDYAKIQDGYIKFITDANRLILKPKVVKENTPYTFRIIAKSETSDENNIGFTALYSDGTNEVMLSNHRTNTNEFISIFTTNKSKTLLWVKSHYTHSRAACIKIDGSMIVEGEYSEATMPDYVEHQGDTFNMPCQKTMYGEEDYFDRENKQEVHGWNKVVFDGTENWTQFGSNIMLNNWDNQLTPQHTYGGVFPGYLCNIAKESNQFSETLNNNTFCTHNQLNVDWIVFNINTTVEDWKTYLAERYANGTPVYVCHKLAKDAIEKLPFTEEQKQIAKQIEKAKSCDGQTDIYSTDEISPNFSITAVGNANEVIDSLDARLTLLEG